VLSGGPRGHGVVFYARDDELVGQVTQYLLSVMRDNGVGVALATAAHCAAIEERLEQAGVSLIAARAHGTYVALDAEEVMSRFMINGFADPAGFWRALSPVIKNATNLRGNVAVFGEMVALLWDRDLASTAVDLEALWNELASQYSFSLLCAYPAEVLQSSEHADELLEVIAAHTDDGDLGSEGGPGTDALARLQADPPGYV
jgi:MEDS: MEthanogen/methylotroph, DcmR Sensory domain